MRLIRLAISSLEAVESLCPRLRNFAAEALSRETGGAQAGLIPLLEATPDVTLVVNRAGEITQANDLARRLLDYPGGSLIGKPIETVIPPGLGRMEGNHAAGREAPPIGKAAAVIARRRDGSELPVEMAYRHARVGRHDVVIVALRDISERDRVEQELRFLADHDPLTNLPNRRRFQQELCEQIARARRYGEQAALLLIDIDGFKSINDAHGHAAGDVALQAISRALRERLRQSDILARVGGDEFAALLLHTCPERAAKVAADLKGVVAACRSDHDNVDVEISIGIAGIDRETPSEDILLAEADQAMYRDKRGERRPS